MELSMRYNSLTDKPQVSQLFKVCCGFIWIRDIFELYLRVFLINISGYAPLANVISYSIIPILVILSFRNLKPIKPKYVLYYIAFCAFYAFSFSLASATEVSDFLSNNCAMILLHNVPLFFIGLCFSDEDLFPTLHRYSQYAILINVAGSIYLLLTGNVFRSGDTMGFSYNLLPHLLLMLGSALMMKKRIDWVYVALGSFIILSYGTRGPVLFIAVYLIILLLFNRTISPLKKFGWVFLIAVMGLVFFECLPIIMNLVSKVSLSGERSTRILESILKGSIADDNGRKEIRTIISKVVGENLFKVRGIGFDRAFYDRWGTKIAYSHNIVLEIVGSFGIVIGAILLLRVFYLYFKVFRTIDTPDTLGCKLVFLSMFCSGGCLKLFLSGSFLMEGFFFLLLGFCTQWCCDRNLNHHFIRFK